MGQAPGRVLADLTVDLPPVRDRIETRELPAFVRLRSAVGRLMRDNASGSPPLL
jgi:NitT/TauT family transport system ATP-binding protein